MALQQRDSNAQCVASKKSGLWVKSSLPHSMHSIACPGCRAPLDGIQAIPHHITSGSCPVLTSLPQWFLDSQQHHQQQQTASAGAASHLLHATTPGRLQQRPPLPADSFAASQQRLGAGISPSPHSVSPFLLRRQGGAAAASSSALPAPPVSLQTCALCSTTGTWIPSAPARSTVRVLSSPGGCLRALCNGCIADMFSSAQKLKSLDPLSCPVSDCSASDRKNVNGNDDDDDDDEDVAVVGRRCDGGSRRRGQVVESDTVGIVTSAQWEELHRSVMASFVDKQVAAGVFVKCPGCEFVAEACYDTDNIDSGQADAIQGTAAASTTMTIEGVSHTRDAANAYRQNRMRCLQCFVTFCSRCFATPFHLGMTCATYRRHVDGGTCRFCQSLVTTSSSTTTVFSISSGPPSHSSSASSHSCVELLPLDERSQKRQLLLPRDVCDDPECVERGLQCCPATRSCGHPCYFSRHAKHLDDEHVCLVPGCASRNALSCSAALPTRDDWCTICYTETLAAGPVVKMRNCPHMFHLECARQKIAAKWPGPRITYGFLGCANCKADMCAPELQQQLEGIQSMRRTLRGMMLERLQYEGLDRRPELVDPALNSPFYQKPELYAEHVFAFYPCYKCGSPFFGGHNRCADGIEGGRGGGAAAAAAAVAGGAVGYNNINNNDGQDERPGSYDPNDLLCSKCIPDGQMRSCRAHGSAFVTFKCKFCCNIAAFFCWGTTHFCKECHRIQESGTYLNKLPISELPVCPGKERCPLGVEHPPNGTAEFALGCALCKT